MQALSCLEASVALQLKMSCCFYEAFSFQYFMFLYELVFTPVYFFNPLYSVSRCNHVISALFHQWCSMATLSE